ncbi:origin recognition complex subunit 4 [Tieghemostelium lacteum]|uniref:Origin recognition complex subunit 4 n=1 Tax=Tieghemostelium lacteum TaxID=361077 RepID=A0A151ZG87_TIELA|nr:origin recognition complex subunit 4 [Tieghemostelium lacteum]|eukprot:KYQ92986.1 origin recognition complex subunit 4 [Tieghemostelium lacteum]
MDIKHINDCKKAITIQIHDSKYIPDKLVGLQESINTLNQLLEEIIHRKKMCVKLITGAKGCGKSTLFRYCLNNFSESSYSLIDISGLRYYSDYKTLKTIISDLELPKPPKSKDTPSMLKYIKEQLGKDSAVLSNTQLKQKKSIIVLVDDFEFLTLQNSRLFFLYNLMDLLHYRNVCLSFICISTPYDVVNSFEKRVKSRFNQLPLKVNPPSTFDFICEIVHNSMTIQQKTLQYGKLTISDRLVKLWNDNVTLLMRDKDFLTQLEFHYRLSNSISYFHLIISKTLKFIDVDNPVLTVNILKEAMKEISRNTNEDILYKISILEFTLLGCILKSMESKSFHQPILFIDLFEKEYKKYATSYYNATEGLDKHSCLCAIENLIHLGMLVIHGSQNGEYTQFYLKIDPEDIFQVAQNRDDCPTALQKYICSWLE